MSYKDRTLVCRDCGKEFVFTAGEQEYYSQKGFLNDPVRCPDCRRARKQSRQRNGQTGRTKYSAPETRQRHNTPDNVNPNEF